MSVMGLDVGTSGCKAIVVDDAGRVLAHSHGGYATSAPLPGRLEIDPEELWRSVQAVIREVCARAADEPVSVVCLATMGDSFVPVDSHGEPTAKFILASDTRSTVETDTLIGEIGYERIYGITGMPPHPINTLTKILWLKNHDPATFRRTAKYLCAEEYVVSRLGLPPTTSHSNACRTMAFDIGARTWSEEMMRAVGIDAGVFPLALPSGEVVGTIPGQIGSALNLGRGVKVVTGGMDQACSALGAGAVGDGIMEDSMGTVEAMSFTVAREALTDGMRRGLLSGHYSINCHAVDDKYLIMALVLSAGSTLRWFAEELGGQARPEGGRPPWDLPLGSTSPCPSRLVFLPYLAGSGTPTMDPLARGLWAGLDLGIRKEDLLRSILQGIVHEIALNLESLEKLGVSPREIRCVGGGSRSDFWLQLRADMLERTVIRMRDTEAAVMGAAILGGTGAGTWASVEEAMAAVVQQDRIFEPGTRYRHFYRLQREIYREMFERTAVLLHRLASMADRLDDLPGKELRS